MSDDLERMLREAFRTECREHVEGIRSALAAVASSVESPEANVDEAHRRAHSLKAAARVCDLAIPEALGQRLEVLFSRALRGAVALSGETLLIACQAADALNEWLISWEAGQPVPEPVELLATFDQLLERPTATPVLRPEAAVAGSVNVFGASMDEDLLAAFELECRSHLEELRALLAEAEQGPTLGLIDEVFRRIHTLKGASRVAGLPQGATVAHRLESFLSSAREDPLRLDAAMIRSVHNGLNFIEDAASDLLQGRPVSSPDDVFRELGEGATTHKPPAPVPHVAPAHSQATEAVRLSAESLDQLLRSAEQLLTEGLGQDRVLRELGTLQRDVEELTLACEAARNGSGAERGATSSPEFLNVLQRIEGQVRSLASRVRLTRRRHRQDSAALRLLGQQLQQDVQRARTVPAEGVFHSFRKMMRDLAQSLGQEIDFRTSGLEAQADRLVLQALKDPLMHVLRNAVCHGIEPPDERRRAGKEPVGRVALRLRVVGNRLRLLVEDDGRGLDLRQVAAEAVRLRGLLSEAKAADASAEELTHQVFQPTFSTAREVTDLAGRGMGLSVVLEVVHRLQGEVELTSPGVGTRVAISVPLSISAQRLLLVRCRDQTFAVPTHSVERVHRVRSSEIETVAGRPALMLSGEPVPLQSLASMLGLGEDEAVDPLPVFVVRQGMRRIAVAVEALMGEREAILKDLDASAARPERWAGAILLDDGAVCLVLNPVGLSPSEGSAGFVPTSRPKVAAVKAKTILVVDDSLTTRTLEKSILEAHGYRVRLALDGMEALSQIRAEAPDLVITDVQMPRLDGFGLLEQMKKETRMSRIPVIVVSSLEKREDQERGLALGADAYVVKRKFDHEELLQIIRQIL